MSRIEKNVYEWVFNAGAQIFLQRFCRSCQFIKIRLGCSNFLEPETPLNFVNFSINLAMEVLLVVG